MSAEYCSSRRTGPDSSGSISAEQAFLDADGQLGQQVGGVVRVHRLQDVRGAGLVQVGQQLLLVVLRQFLQDVGQPVVVEHVGDLVAQPRCQLAQDAGRVGGAQPLEGGEHLLGPLTVGELGRVHAADVRPGHHLHRRPAPIRRVRSRTASRETTQSRVRVRSIAASTTMAALAVVGQLNRGAEQLADDERLVVRCSNRRMLTEPVASATACDSRLLTRSIGTKIGRRVGSSTTRPSTRGGLPSSRTRRRCRGPCRCAPRRARTRRDRRVARRRLGWRPPGGA